MVKWRLLLTTLPFVAAALVIKIALERLLGFQGLIEFSDMSLVLTAGTFLTGFMLAGTLADYKEAEKLPAELACGLESIEETFLQVSIGRPAIELATERKTVLEAGTHLWDWLHKKRTQDEMLASLERLGHRLADLEAHGAGPHASRGLRELHNVRRNATRIAVISRTGFVAAGYALLEVLTVLILGMTLLGHFKNLLTEIVLVPFVALIFVYMLRFIRDLDDPFDYTPEGSSGSVEVELFPLQEYLDRLRARTEKQA
jgi:hypothetical protein